MDLDVMDSPTRTGTRSSTRIRHRQRNVLAESRYRPYDTSPSTSPTSPSSEARISRQMKVSCHSMNTRQRERFSQSTLNSPEPQLKKPIVIPVSRSSSRATFLRAYPTCLASYNISKVQFFQLLDRINEIKTVFPSSAVLGDVAGVLGYEHVSEVTAVSLEIEGAANFGVDAAGQTTLENLIHNMNKEIFIPKGLKMEIANLDAVSRMADMEYLSNAKGKASRKVDALHMVEQLVRTRRLSTQQRRLDALQPWVEQLELVPLEKPKPCGSCTGTEGIALKMFHPVFEPDVQQTWFEMASEYQREITKIQEELDRELSMLNSETNQFRFEDESRPSKSDRKLKDVNEDRPNILRGLKEDLEVADEDRREGDKEQEDMRCLVFLTIRNLDADSGTEPNPYL